MEDCFPFWQPFGIGFKLDSGSSSITIGSFLGGGVCKFIMKIKWNLRAIMDYYGKEYEKAKYFMNITFYPL